MADGAAVAVFINVAARFDDRADEPIVDELHVAAQRRARAALGAVLHHAAVLFSRGHKLPSFINAVRERFLDIDVFARLAAPDGRQRMPMIGRGDGDGINLLVFQGLADVPILLGGLALGGLDGFRAPLQHVGINVTQGDIFGVVLHAQDVLDVGAALAVEADGTHPDAVVGAENLAGRHRAGDQHRRGCFSEKLSAS